MNVMASYIQSPRMMKIMTPLGDDALLLERLSGVERVNELFHFEITVRAKRTDIKADELIGELIDVTMNRHGNAAERGWNGLVVGLEEESKVSREFRHYTLTMRPHAWLLSQRTNCRIWLDKTSLDVVSTLLSEHGIRAADIGGVVDQPPQRHYSVQWNETDLDYLLRRLQEDGLFYWFRHESGAHQMVIASHASGWDKGINEGGGQGGGEGPVRLARGSSDRDQISEWKRRFTFKPGKRAGRDWNFETPTIVPGNATPSLVPLSKNTSQELYEFPARAMSNETAEKAMKLRNQAIEADHQRIFGASTVRWLSPGRKFTPYEVGAGAETYETAVIVAIEHFAEDTSYETGSGTPSYSNRFEALPADLPATPHRTVPQPRVEGSQIAIIAGPAGEEIHCDEYGRVKVWFPWDRDAKKDGSDTCWMRVVQNWAGAGWGGQIVPRIGMEALVFCENGDPDRPIVAGLSANPQQKVPYLLPGNKTKSTFRTNTHKGQGFNELSFEDEKGMENVFLHAQKDQTIKVLNNRSKRVEAHEIESVGKNKNIDVGGNHQERIAGNRTLSVGGKGAGLLSMLSTVVSAGGQFMQKNSGQVGSQDLTSFAGAVAKVGQVAEQLAMTANSAFNGAGNHRSVGGADLAGKGNAIGNLLSKLLPGSGTLSVIVEKFRSDTVGVARTEQIGLYKNSVVGHTYSVSVGKKKKELIGEDLDIEAKKSIFSRTKKHTVLAKEKVVVAGPGGSITIDASGITLRAKQIRFKSPSIIFEKGSPDQVDALSSDKPFVEECKNKG